MPGSGDERAARPVAGHAVALATVRAFCEASGAQRVAVLLDTGDGEGTAIECEPGAPAVLTTADGESLEVPASAGAPAAARDLDVPLAPPGTAVEVDLALDRVSAPVGVLPSLADGVLALARALGGRSVATAEFATSDPERPLTVAARDGEGVVLAVGDEHFEL